MATKKRRDHPEFAFAQALKNPKTAEELRGWLSITKQPTVEIWRGEFLLPPETLLFHAVEAFRVGTDFPLELPYLATLHYVAGLLLSRGITLQIDSTCNVAPTVWSACLAESGGGKSTTLHFLREAFCAAGEVEVPIEGVSGARSFFDAVKAKPRGLWVEDEFGQNIRNISDPKNATWKALMLRLGTGDDLRYATGKDGAMLIKQPRISLLGLTQTALWTQHVPPEALLDGLCARFCYMLAREDQNRPPQQFPRYNLNTGRLGEYWKKMCAQLCENYTASPDALCYYDQYFRENWPGDLPRAFARRMFFATHRFALLYHVICSPAEPFVDRAAYVYAFRLLRIFLTDAKELLGDHNMSELARILAAAQRASERYLQAQKPFGVRELLKSVRAINNAGTARAVWEFLWPRAKDYVLRPSSNNTAIL